MPPMTMDHVSDPVQEIINAIGNLDDVEVFNNQVLCAIYLRPEKTIGGVYLPDAIRDEDRFQGKVGLAMKMGPSAFIDLSEKWFQGIHISTNEWLLFRPSDGWPIMINNVHCRMLSDTDIKGRVARPDQAW